MSNAATSRSLGEKILRETVSFAGIQVFAAVLAWGANISLARLLDRRDFGVYGICTFFIGLGALLGDGGLGAALLRRREEFDRDDLRAALTASLSIALLMAVALVTAAPWIGAHNRLTPAEIQVLRAMAPLYLVGALRLVPYVRLERSLRFGVIARVELAASVARHVVAIVVALLKGGVWALVVSNLVGAALQVTLAYTASPGWPGIGTRWSRLRPLLSYGGQVQSLGLFAYFKDNLSRAMLGAAMGPAAVGLFDFGLAYIQVPVVAVNSLARVQLPVYARLDRTDPVLYQALRGATRTAVLLGVPMLAVMAVAAPWLVPTVYGARWQGAFPVIDGLLLNMAGGLVASPLFTLLQGQGKAGLAVGVFAVWTAATWALAIAFVWFLPGSLGAIAWAHSAITACVVVGMIAWAGRHLGRGLWRAYAIPLGAGVLSVLAGRGARSEAWVAHPLSAAAITACTYVLLVLLAERRQVLGDLRTVISGVRRRTPPTVSQDDAHATAETEPERNAA